MVNTYPNSSVVDNTMKTKVDHYNDLRKDLLYLGQADTNSIDISVFLEEMAAWIDIDLLETDRLRIPYSSSKPPTVVINGCLLQAIADVDLDSGAKPSGAAATYYVFLNRANSSTTFTITVNTSNTPSDDQRLIGEFEWDGVEIVERSINNYYEDQGVVEGYVPTNAYKPSGLWERKSGDNSVIQSPVDGLIEINGTDYVWVSQVELDVDTAGDWDTVAGTDYSTAANRAGEDFYVYAVEPASGSTPDFMLSANSTVPSGETADTSRKLAGFHCLCVDVGAIAGHALTGYLQGDILPESVWDLFHRPVSSPEGMVWSEKAGIWVDIYLTSGTGGSTASEYNQTISDTRTWLDFVDDYAAVNKQMLSDVEFQIIAAGSNEETNISGSSDPVTTGGHSDTSSDRMISDIGCEDCAGAMWQWLETPSARADFNIGTDSGDEDDVHGWENLPGSKGSFYTYGISGYFNTQLHAGGGWHDGAYCGSRSRYAHNVRWAASTHIGGRGRSEPRATRF